MFAIVHEYFLHLNGKIPLIDKCVDFEIVFQATEIHIGRTDTGNIIITKQKFGMQKSLLIKINLHPSPDHLCQERAGSQIGHLGIRMFRQHDTHVYPPRAAT